MYINTSENELKRQNRTFFVKVSLQIGKKTQRNFNDYGKNNLNDKSGGRFLALLTIVYAVLALHKSKNRAKSVSPPDPVQYGIVLLRARVSYLRDSSTEIAYVSPT